MTTTELKEQYKEHITTEQSILMQTIDYLRTYDAKVTIEMEILAYHNIIRHLIAQRLSLPEIFRIINFSGSEASFYVLWNKLFKEKFRDIPRKSRLQIALERRMDSKEVTQILKELEENNEI